MFGFDDTLALLTFLLRILAAVIAGVVVWYLSTPLVSMLYRVAFHRKPNIAVMLGGRAVISGIAAFLAFLFLGFMGFGPGPGEGGPKLAEGKGPNATETKDIQKNKPKTPTDIPDPSPKEKDKLLVEIVRRDRFFEEPDWQNKERYYWVDGKKAMSRDELELYLYEHKGKWGTLELRIWKNSFYPEHESVGRLRNLATKMQLKVDEDTKYRKMQKT